MHSTRGQGVLAARDGLLPAGVYEHGDATLHQDTTAQWRPGALVVIAHTDPGCFTRAAPLAMAARKGPGAVVSLLDEHVPGTGARRCACVEGHDLDDVDQALFVLGSARVRARSAAELTELATTWNDLPAATVAERHAAAFTNAVFGSGHGAWGSLGRTWPVHRPADSVRALLDCATRLDKAAAAAAAGVAPLWPAQELAVACSAVNDPQVVWVAVPKAVRQLKGSAAVADLAALSVLAAAPVVASSTNLVVAALSGSAHAALVDICELPGGVDPMPGVRDQQWAVALAMLEDNSAMPLDVALSAAGHSLLVA